MSAALIIGVLILNTIHSSRISEKANPYFEMVSNTLIFLIQQQNVMMASPARTTRHCTFTMLTRLSCFCWARREVDENTDSIENIIRRRTTIQMTLSPV